MINHFLRNLTKYNSPPLKLSSPLIQQLLHELANSSELIQFFSFSPIALHYMYCPCSLFLSSKSFLPIFLVFLTNEMVRNHQNTLDFSKSWSLGLSMHTMLFYIGTLGYLRGRKIELWLFVKRGLIDQVSSWNWCVETKKLNIDYVIDYGWFLYGTSMFAFP